MSRFHKRDLDVFNKKHLDAPKNWQQSNKSLKPTTIDKPSKSINYKTQVGDIFAIGNNFTAATVSNVKNANFIPPNQTGAVGPEQYILMTVDPIIRSFNKITGEPDNVLNIDTANFFGSEIEGQIRYDRFSRKWCLGVGVFSQNFIETGPLLLAVSEDAVITKCTKWHFYTVPLDQFAPDGSSSIDYPQLAIDQNAVYINTDTFDVDGNYLGTSSVVFQKSSLVEENPVVTVFSGLLPGGVALAPNEKSPTADNFDHNPKYA